MGGCAIEGELRARQVVSSPGSHAEVRCDQARISAAARRLAGAAVNTPILRIPGLTHTDSPVLAKAECLQRTGSFKFRGAYNAMATLAARGVRSVVTFSSGNHGLATAAAGAQLGVRVQVLMPHDSPSVKQEAVRRYHGSIHFYDRYQEDRHELAARIADACGSHLLASSGHIDIIAGAATAVMEVLEVSRPQVLLVPVGGGGLLAGAVAAVEATEADVRVVGIESDARPALQMSFRRGHRVDVEVGRTWADGLQVPGVTPLAWELVRDKVDLVWTVSDRDIRDAMRHVLRHTNLMPEPSSVVGVAAAHEHKEELAGLRVATVLTGGNVAQDHLLALDGN